MRERRSTNLKAAFTIERRDEFALGGDANPRPSDDRHNTLRIAGLHWLETSEVNPIKISSDAGLGFAELLWKRNLPSPAVRATSMQRLVNA